MVGIHEDDQVNSTKLFEPSPALRIPLSTPPLRQLRLAELQQDEIQREQHDGPKQGIRRPHLVSDGHGYLHFYDAWSRPQGGDIWARLPALNLDKNNAADWRPSTSVEANIMFKTAILGFALAAFATSVPSATTAVYRHNSARLYGSVLNLCGAFSRRVAF